jgi:hypothetical protein
LAELRKFNFLFGGEFHDFGHADAIHAKEKMRVNAPIKTRRLAK